MYHFGIFEPNIRLTGVAVKPVKRHEQTSTHTQTHTHSRKTPPPGSHHSGLLTQGDGQNPPSEDVFQGST